jgi:hypothetical protein
LLSLAVLQTRALKRTVIILLALKNLVKEVEEVVIVILVVDVGIVMNSLVQEGFGTAGAFGPGKEFGLNAGPFGRHGGPLGREFGGHGRHHHPYRGVFSSSDDESEDESRALRFHLLKKHFKHHGGRHGGYENQFYFAA